MSGIIAGGCLLEAWNALRALARLARRAVGRCVCGVRGHQPTDWSPTRCRRCGRRIR